MIVDNLLSESNALIAGWLPGTSGGQGVVNSVIGDYTFRPNGESDKKNTLSIDWPKNMVFFCD